MTLIGSEDTHALLIEDLIGCNVPDQHTYNSLTCLLKVLENIKNCPQDPKFRILKTSNAAIVRLMSLAGVSELLDSCNFIGVSKEVLEYCPTEESDATILKVLRLLGPRVRTMEVISEIEPGVLKMVNERKKKVEDEKAYKSKVISQIECDRKDYKAKHHKQRY